MREKGAGMVVPPRARPQSGSRFVTLSRQPAALTVAVILVVAAVFALIVRISGPGQVTDSGMAYVTLAGRPPSYHGAVIPLDLATRRVGKPIKAGPNLVAIALIPGTTSAYVVNNLHAVTLG